MISKLKETWKFEEAMGQGKNNQGVVELVQLQKNPECHGVRYDPLWDLQTVEDLETTTFHNAGTVVPNQPIPKTSSEDPLETLANLFQDVMYLEDKNQVKEPKPIILVLSSRKVLVS